MLGWVLGVCGTFVLSLVFAAWLLKLRCGPAGTPFGPRARPWGVLVVLATAIVSTGVGLVIMAAAHHPPAAYIGIVVPGGLWFTGVSAPRDRPGSLITVLRLPLSRLYDRMGDDLEAWCDTRRIAAAQQPQWIARAAKYYYDQVSGEIKDARTLDRLDGWRESITHKIGLVRLINLDTTPGRLQATLQSHPSTRNQRRYSGGDLPRLALRLEADAANELNLLLAQVYRLGYRKLLVYPLRLAAHRELRVIPYEQDPAGPHRQET